MAPPGFEFLRDAARSDLFEYALDMATFGVRPHGSRPPTTFKQQAYASFRGDPVTTASELWGDLARGDCSFSLMPPSPTPGTWWSPN